MRTSVLVGLIGSGIHASRSAALPMEKGYTQRLSYQYKLIDLTVLCLGVEALPALLRAAGSAVGCRTVDGGGMGVFQAVEAFRLFSGVRPDSERIRRHFLSMG